MDGLLASRNDTVEATDLSPGTHVISLFGTAGRDDEAVEILLDEVTITVETAATGDEQVLVSRTAGADRYETAAEVARLQWPTGAPAAALASTPLLLTESDQLPEDTARAMTELGVTRVRIIGGTAAVSADVAEEIAALLTSNAAE